MSGTNHTATADTASDTARMDGEGHIGLDVRIGDTVCVMGRPWVVDRVQLEDRALVHGDARLFHDASVSEDASVGGMAEVDGSARISGHAHVCGYARVGGTADIVGGLINGDALVMCAADIVQIRHDGIVYSRFATRSGGYRTTGSPEEPWILAAFDAWQAGHEARKS